MQFMPVFNFSHKVCLIKGRAKVWEWFITTTIKCVFWCTAPVEMAVGGFDFLMWFKLMDEQEVWGLSVDVCLCGANGEKLVF